MCQQNCSAGEELLGQEPKDMENEVGKREDMIPNSPKHNTGITLSQLRIGLTSNNGL